MEPYRRPGGDRESRDKTYREEPEWKLQEIADQAVPSFQQTERMRVSIQKTIQETEGRMGMKRWSGRKMMVAAAVIAVLGAGTAVAAGKIVSLSSSTQIDQVDYASAGEVKASEKLDKKAKAVDAFSNGIQFERGYYTEVSAQDESGVQVAAYPSISVDYSEDVFLDISKPVEGVESGAYPVVLSGEFDGVTVEISSMEYLFLPPDERPSAEDEKRQEEGTLEISYGSQEEERKTYLGASWKEDGLTYNLMTMEHGLTAEEILAMAGEIIESK